MPEGLRLTPTSYGPREVGLGLATLFSVQLMAGLALVGSKALLGADGSGEGSDPSAEELRLALGATLLYDLFIVGLVAFLANARSAPRLARAVSLQWPEFSRIWLPTLCVVLMYGFVAAYAGLAGAFGPQWLEPRSTVPKEITSDPWTLALAGILTCLVAPLAEEIFFRGLLTRGLLRWGTWPALLIPALIFSAVHLDPGSFFPFAVVGLVIGWLYWRRGSLTDAVVFHFLFNSTSFVLLVLAS